jgi:hypothetical protein
METMQEIYGFRYDFIHQHGLVMKLHREGGIFAQELSELQLRMLESNTIPRLLPLEVQEIDFQIHFLYKLNSKRMLSQVIKAEGLTNVQLIKLMYSIVCAMDQSGSYMLNETQYLLKENFIFIGTEITDVYLTYLPFKQLVGEIPMYHQVETLLQRLVEKVKQEEREGIDTLLLACNENFNLTGFKQMLLERLGEVQSTKQPSISSIPKSSGTAGVEPLPQSSLPTDLKIDVKPSFPPLPTPLLKKHAAPAAISFNQPITESKSHMHEGDLSTLLTRQNKWIVLTIFTIMIALIWKNYLDHQQDSVLYVSSGVTILLVDVWFVFSFIGLPKSWETSIVFKKNRREYEEHARLMGNWSSEGTLVGDQVMSEPNSKIHIQDYYRNLHQHTTLLSAAPNNATVFLGGGGAGAAPFIIRAAMIEVSKEGITQHIPIKGNTFMIGRGETDADYAENEAGISRLHAEIYKAVEGYGVKDLGSKNGTYLNEEQLVPYQCYPVKQGDTIRIVRTEFRLIV